MEEGKVSENQLTSAAAFVEGGIQDACDDACSICLEAFLCFRGWGRDQTPYIEV
nr:E3 ubiquitin-protein ligase RHF2A-like [Ipomoea batatas]